MSHSFASYGSNLRTYALTGKTEHQFITLQFINMPQ